MRMRRRKRGIAKKCEGLNFFCLVIYLTSVFLFNLIILTFEKDGKGGFPSFFGF